MNTGEIWRDVPSANCLSADKLRSLLAYDPETGVFRWRKPRPNCTPGTVAGGKTSYGYWKISIEGRPYLAHRLVWLLSYGTWPEQEIDHANGVRDDNRLRNLRVATASQNQANKGMRADNASGVKGVCWDKSRKMWLAGISINGRQKFLGRFAILEQAAAAYEKAAREQFGQFARPERAR